MKEKIAIIGGGIVGSTAAYYLVKAGYDVTLYDEGTGQATKAAAGIICPWFTLRRNKPWYFLVSNGAEFYRRFMQDLAEDNVATDQIFQEVGTLLIRKNEASLERDLQRAEDRLPQSPSIKGVSTVRQAELTEYFPLLNCPYDASLVTGGARLDGAQLIASLHKVIQELGGLLINERVGLTTSNNQATPSVTSSQGTIHYDRILLAAGAWLPDLLTPLGYDVAISPQKGQLFSIYQSEWEENNWPVVMPPGKFDIIPFANGEIVIGATHEKDRGYDLAIEPERLNELRDKALPLLPILAEHTEHYRVKVGTRAYTPDYTVLVGAVPELNNVWAVSGLGASGLTSGPFIGHQWATLIQTGKWSLSPSDYPIHEYIKKI